MTVKNTYSASSGYTGVSSGEHLLRGRGVESADFPKKHSWRSSKINTIGNAHRTESSLSETIPCDNERITASKERVPKRILYRSTQIDNNPVLVGCGERILVKSG